MTRDVITIAAAADMNFLEVLKSGCFCSRPGFEEAWLDIIKQVIHSKERERRKRPAEGKPKHIANDTNILRQSGTGDDEVHDQSY